MKRSPKEIKFYQLLKLFTMSVDRINLVTTLGGNTGKTLGDVRMGRPKIFLFTRGKEFSEADRADSETFEEALETAMLLSRESVNKVFCFTGFREAEDGTGDPNVGTMADGFEEVLNEALVKFVLRHTAGVAQTQSFVAFNGWSDKVFMVDDKNVLWGVKTSSNGVKGFSVGYLYSTPPKPGNTGNVNSNQVRITFGDLEEFKSGLVALKLDFNVADLQNIVDVQLEEVGAAAGYVFKIGASTKYAGTNVYDTYKDLLAVVGAWEVIRLDTGAAVTVDSVVKNDATKGWDITLDDAVAIANGVKLKINLKNPTVLAALGTPVTGIEGVYARVVKAA